MSLFLRGAEPRSAGEPQLAPVRQAEHGSAAERGSALFSLLLFMLLPVVGWGAETQKLPPALRNVGFDQNLNAQVPLDAPFRDESGDTVNLRRYLGRRPAILALVYYECPMLCTLELNGLTRALRVLSLKFGQDFEIVTVSFNPKDTPATAAAKKANYVSDLRRPEAAHSWHFLTGDQPSIEALTRAVGFRYNYDPVSKQYAHASGILVLTPEGRLARYFYGVDYSARDLRLALVEASAGKIGNPVDQFLLYCYHYDPSSGKYTLLILKLLRIFAVLTLTALLGLIAFLSWRTRRVERLKHA